MIPTVVKEVIVQSLDIPLLESFGIAGGTQDVASNALITVVLNDGTRGYGEAAPLPPFNGETQTMALAALKKLSTQIEGEDVRHWRRLIGNLHQEGTSVMSAQCALETAILDALTRHAHIPLWSFFGGMETKLETDMTVAIPATLSPEESIVHARHAAANITEREIRVIKTKVGAGDMDLDIERVKAIHDQTNHAPLILDGNCGFTAEEALEMLHRLEHMGIIPILFEQPVAKDDLSGLRSVNEAGLVPVAADESATDAARVRQIIEMKAASVVNIKLMKSGFVEALQIAALCQTSGISLMIGGMVESVLAMTASACFAAGIGGFRYVDLDTPLFMAENPFTGGYQQQGAWLDLTGIQEGHGVFPRQIG